MSNISMDRIIHLADPGSYEPWKPLNGSGYHLGRIKVDGRPAYILATDIDQVLQISPLDSIARQVEFLASISDTPAPLVQMLDIPAYMKIMKGKTPIPPDAMGLLAGTNGIGRTYAELGKLHGVIPRISIVFGNVGAALSFPAALCDAAVMLESSALCIGRPDAVTLMTGQQTDFQQLGGAQMHSEVTGIAHKLAKTEAGALTWTRQWLGYWPDHTKAQAPVSKAVQPSRDISEIGATLNKSDLNASFDIHDLIYAVTDSGSWLEMGSLHAPECITGLCRIQGRPLAIVAGNSAARGGILFPESCRKMIRFVRLCGEFNMPIAFLADTPGFMVGAEVERQGNVQAAADLYSTLARSPSAKVCVVVRKAYSAGLYAMAGAGFGAQFWAMPGASISVFGPEAIHRFCQNKDIPEVAREAAKTMLASALDPEAYVDKGLVDQVVPWELLRGKLANFAKLPSSSK